MTTPSSIGFGIAGLGMGATLMVRGIVRHPRVRIVAGASRTAEVRERFAHDLEATAYDNVEAMCADPAVDVVFVATPHELHPEHAMLAASYGKHVIVEKPMALTLEACDAMIESAASNGVHLLVGPTMSSAPAMKAMREIIVSGELGPVRMITTWDSNDFMYRARRPEELDTALGGGVIFNQGPHQVDIVRYLGGGLLESVRAGTGAWDPSRPTEGSYMAFCQLVGGATATMIYNGYDGFDISEFQTWIEPERRKSPSAYGQAKRSLQSVGSPEDEAALKRRLFSWGGQVFGSGPGGTDQQHSGITVVSCERGDMRPWANGVAVYDANGRRELPLPPSHGTPIRAEVVDELVAALDEGRRPIRDGRWGKATMEVCLALLESARDRREIPLRHQIQITGA